MEERTETNCIPSLGPIVRHLVTAEVVFAPPSSSRCVSGQFKPVIDATTCLERRLWPPVTLLCGDGSVVVVGRWVSMPSAADWVVGVRFVRTALSVEAEDRLGIALLHVQDLAHRVVSLQLRHLEHGVRVVFLVPSSVGCLSASSFREAVVMEQIRGGGGTSTPTTCSALSTLRLIRLWYYTPDEMGDDLGNHGRQVHNLVIQ